MAVLHDIAELRVGDQNLVNRHYVSDKSEKEAFGHMWGKSGVGQELIEIYNSYGDESLETRYLKDCDILARTMFNKEVESIGID